MPQRKLSKIEKSSYATIRAIDKLKETLRQENVLTDEERRILENWTGKIYNMFLN